MSWKLLRKYTKVSLRLVENFSGDRIYLGVSGGVDSMVMLHYFHFLYSKKYINKKLVILHLDHSISVGSEEAGSLIANLCKKQVQIKKSLSMALLLNQLTRESPVKM